MNKQLDIEQSLNKKDIQLRKDYTELVKRFTLLKNQNKKLKHKLKRFNKIVDEIVEETIDKHTKDLNIYIAQLLFIIELADKDNIKLKEELAMIKDAQPDNAVHRNFSS